MDSALLERAITWAEDEADKPDGKWYQNAWLVIPRADAKFERCFCGCGGEMPRWRSLGLFKNGPIEAPEEAKFCLAGKIADMAGCKWVNPDTVVHPETGWPVSVPVFAAEQLGLTEAEAAPLFRGDNSLRSLRRHQCYLEKMNTPESKAPLPADFNLERFLNLIANQPVIFEDADFFTERELVGV